MKCHKFLCKVQNSDLYTQNIPLVCARGGGAIDASPHLCPISYIFMQFLANSYHIIGFWSKLRCWRSLKEILVLPLHTSKLKTLLIFTTKKLTVKNRVLMKVLFSVLILLYLSLRVIHSTGIKNQCFETCYDRFNIFTLFSCSRSHLFPQHLILIERITGLGTCIDLHYLHKNTPMF